MKIKLNYIHPNNYGNLMMASVFIENFIKMYKKNYDLVVDVETEEELERLKKSLNDKNLNIGMDNRIYTSKSSNKFIKLKDKIKEMNRQASLFDVNVYLGGDCISEYYSKIGFVFDALSIYLKSKKSKVFLVGQTIGPFTSYRKLIARFCLKDTIIYTRDNTTYKYLRDKVKLKNVFEHRDLAFLPIPHEENKEITLERFNLNEDEYVTIVPSGLHKSYTDNIEDYLNTYTKIIENLMISEHMKNKKIVLLAHVIHNDNSNDKYVIDELYKRFEKNKQVISITELLMPHEARIILGNGLFTITGRMHAAVSTFEMNKPAISLSYSVKYKGVIGHGLDMNELIIESAGNEKWNGNLESDVLVKCDYVFQNYDFIINKISKNVKKTKDKSLNQIKDLVNRL